MSRRGNCYDNAVAESFFQRIKRRIYKDREQARQDILSRKSGSIQFESSHPDQREPQRKLRLFFSAYDRSGGGATPAFFRPV